MSQQFTDRRACGERGCVFEARPGQTLCTHHLAMRDEPGPFMGKSVTAQFMESLYPWMDDNGGDE